MGKRRSHETYKENCRSFHPAGVFSSAIAASSRQGCLGVWYRQLYSGDSLTSVCYDASVYHTTGDRRRQKTKAVKNSASCKGYDKSKLSSVFYTASAVSVTIFCRSNRQLVYCRSNLDAGVSIYICTGCRYDHILYQPAASYPAAYSVVDGTVSANHPHTFSAVSAKQGKRRI